MGCGCKNKGKSKNTSKSMPVNEFRKKYSKPEKEVVNLTENDLKNLINKVISKSK